ncbi:hypothetical protein BBO99_00002290 [Phytophthora kernoviae]|uniref:FYVE-type domain-containing protein n=2 Tax=Phytophthora kernoviae TaxID=325452 RepID=A0A3R7K3C2_9STRA|nr:hypothetical protein G195_002706 [Phytophthora kernoviae 00238/432]KAG2528646.1 hypothetical protein JM16_002595 [Phytophthora kernoviae]KAG2530511.1 hypothetical protein JM18_002095 [Phytophthora kernoviae]RLN10699.1 hypothetical protein BBI17_002178 [Phytophthora kernoviae]RLN83252.1 hypothetical protein BBO99_00002290 [Phytophthora kernoviae]
MVQQYTYSRSPDHPYAMEMLPLPKEEQDNLRMDAHTAYSQLFPAVQAAVRIGSDGEIFNISHRDNSKSMAMWTTSMLFGTLEEVAALYLDRNGRVPIVLDSARSRRLYELNAPSNDRPLHGVAMRWSLWKPPSKMSDGRDLCYLEYMDSFVDQESGRRVWARAIRSINHLCCPSSQHPEGPVRTYMRVSGMILRETERPNVLEHVTFIHVDAKGVPNWVVQQAINVNKKAANSLNQVLKVMRQLKPASSSIDSTKGEGDGSRDCRSCGDRVSKWTVAKRCRFCDVILCKRCVEICYHRADASGKNHRMCLSCALYNGSVVTSRSMSGLEYNRPMRSKTRARTATIVGERKLSASTLSALSKQNSLPTFTSQSSVCSEPSISIETDSMGSGSREDMNAVRERLEQWQIQSPSSSSMGSSSASSMPSGREWMQRSRVRVESLALALELEPQRPEPIDLSYLTTLVTPRAGATRSVDI